MQVTEYTYFDSYIFPAILAVHKVENHDLILVFFNNINKIIDLQLKKFSIKSQIIKNKTII